MAMTDPKWPDTTPGGLREWTVMVYMAAGNNAELDAIAVKDLREMERGVGRNGDNADVHVVAQINRAWPESLQRYEIRPSASRSRAGESFLRDVDVESHDMGNGDTLTRFLEWVPTMFPARHYALILWGHAYGLGFGRDHNNALTSTGIKEALEAFSQARSTQRKAASDSPLELLGANACAMSYVEAAYELRNSADFMVASQIAVPFAGWPYESIISRIRGNTDAETLGRLIVDTYVGQYNAAGREKVTMSLLDLRTLRPRTNSNAKDSRQANGFEDLKNLIRRLAVGISEETRVGRQFNSDRLAHIRDVFIAAAAGDVRPLVDLRDLCADFDDAGFATLTPVTDGILKFLEGHLVKHHAGHPDLDDLHGVGIFAPFVTDDRDLLRLELQDAVHDSTNGRTGLKSSLELGRNAYERLAIFDGRGGAAWPRLVYDELRQEIPDELMGSVAGVGSGSRERRDITQIVLAIDSSFNKLDRALAHAKESIRKDFGPAQGDAVTGRIAAIEPGEKRFGLPWIRLAQPVDRANRFRSLNRAIESRHAVHRSLGTIDSGADAYSLTADEGLGSVAMADPQLVTRVVNSFANVEKSIGDVERAVRKGLTNASFGLGPTALGEFEVGVEEQPKSGHGPVEEQPKSGHGVDEQPKSGHGANLSNGTAASLAGDLRLDLALTRVADLFRQVGQALQRLEQASADAEITAGAILAGEAQHLSGEDRLAAAEEIARAFCILEDASKSARRTVRRVVSHPMYGLGPASGTLGFEGREALASAGGLDRRNLRLLSRGLVDESRT